jgi:hypothetical protein
MPKHYGDKKKSKAKSNYQFDRSIKVKQSTIDAIKAKGMEGALKSAKGNAEYEEGIKRLYGARRYEQANRKTSTRTTPRDEKSGKDMKRMSAGPKMGGGQGYASASKSSKTKTGRGSKVAAGIGAAAAVGAAGIYAKGKSVAKKRAGMTAAQLRADNKRVQERTKKIAGSKTGKAIGKTARAVTSTAAKRTAIGAAALYAAPKAMSTLREQKQKTEARRKASKKDSSAGGARAAAMKRARGR